MSRPALFPIHPEDAGEDYSCDASRVGMITIPRSMWTGSTFGSIKPDEITLRQWSVYKFLMQHGIQSGAEVSIETIYHNGLQAGGIKLVTHYRLWIVFQNIDRVESFNESIKTHFAKEETAGGRKHKRQKKEPPAIPGTWKKTKYSDLVHVIAASFLGSNDEVLNITFDHAGSDVNGLDDEEIVEDPINSLIYRISAERAMDSAAHELRSTSWDVQQELRDFDTYVTDPDESTSQFLIPADRANSFQRLSGTNAYAWLQDVDRLHEFCLPHIEPTMRDMREAVAQSLSAAGMHMPDLTDDAIKEHLRSTLQGAYLNTPIRRSEIAASISGNTWSNQVVRTALPVQYEYQTDAFKLLEDVRSAFQEGNLTLESVQYVDRYLLTFAQSLVTPGLIIEGFPAGPQRVTEHHKRDLATFSGIVNGRNKEQSGLLKSYYFPQIPDESKDALARPSFWYRTQAEYLYYDGALSAQQTHICIGVFCIGFGVDYPGFGWPCHIMATGPPAVGKSYAMKATQANLNNGKYYACNSESKFAATFKGFIEQVLYIQDENETAKSQSGTTGQLQSILVDGVITRVRADVDLEKAVTTTVANRRYAFTAGNDKHVNAALESRYIHLQVTGTINDKQASAFRKQSDSYALGCLSNKVFSGRTVAPWMLVMLGLCEEPDTRPFEVYCAIHAAVFPDSVLKENPRVKQMVLTMSMFSSLMHMISYYERVTPKPLEDLFTVDFLNFLRANWVIDPYSIIFSATTQLTGVDPNAEYKVLALLKNNIRRDAQDRIALSADMNYHQTTLWVGDPRLQDLTNAIGIGYAIFENVVGTLMLKSAAQMPAVITESQGNRKDFYCVHPGSCATIRTLSAVEDAIVKHLYSCKSRALVSSNLKNFVFPAHVRRSILVEHLRPPALKDISNAQMDGAITSLEKCGIWFYEDNNQLKLQRDAQVVVTQPHNTPGSVLADPGSLLDLDYSGDKYYKDGMVMANVIEWDGDMFQEYEAILNKQDPLIIEREQKEKRVIDYFMHSMQTPRDCTVEEEIYMGIFDDGTVNMHEVQECTESLMIANPDFKASSSRRMSTGGPDISSSAFFPSARQKIDIVQYTSLMQKATEERAATMLYGVDDTQRVYGDDGLLFDSV